MGNYYLNSEKQFVIEDYDNQKPFASFLPGVAGLHGIPMWAYYVNRGQGIASFGVENKDGALLDFDAANIAYRVTEQKGYRTFIKFHNEVHEIFSSSSTDKVERKMFIEANYVSFEEKNMTLGIKVNVSFTTVTNEPYPGLLRKLTIAPIDRAVELEVVDGIATIWPYKTKHHEIKNQSNLTAAWFDVLNGQNNLPFYKNRSSTDDSSSVSMVDMGHFYVAVSNQSNARLPIIYDPDIIFKTNTQLSKAIGFENNSVSELYSMTQISANKIPCAFVAIQCSLDKPLELATIAGRMNSIDVLNDYAQHFTLAYCNVLFEKSSKLLMPLTNAVACQTAYPLFDGYVKQSFLDNVLRGGYPIVFDGKNEPIIYHVYSRIHGDLEREYNPFYAEASYYSQGNGHFRDVNQNRRNDVYFVPEAGKYNIKQFMDYIQFDGNNPLLIKGSVLRVDKAAINKLLAYVVNEKHTIKTVLSDTFTPGELLTMLDMAQIKLSTTKDEFLSVVLAESIQEHRSEYGHGYWSDHFSYNMDLIDNYLAIFPDQLEQLLYTPEYRFFESRAIVLPRSQKYVLNEVGNVRQYDAVITDNEKINQLSLTDKHMAYTKGKDGQDYYTTLFEKLMGLALMKMTSLDQSGVGIMMNTDKPGWNDALNGLPGLFGSSINETIEVKRIVKFLYIGLDKKSNDIRLSTEYATLLDTYVKMLEDNKQTELSLWESVQRVKETFCESIRFGISGDQVVKSSADIYHQLQILLNKLDTALTKALELGNGIMPSYLIHEATRYEVLDDMNHPINGLPIVNVTEWSMGVLPLYLEAPARYFKLEANAQVGEPMYRKIKSSDLYDKKLKMYVTSESLDNESMEIGRARAFTPGWLERESVFMHMEYKYLIGLLKSKLYHAFYEEIKTILPPFMNPEVYGRSVLENCSFIASSRNPNPYNHGRGFVSRLTGTTAEVLSIYMIMMIGTQPFLYEDGQLKLNLKPTLDGSWFTTEGVIKFMLLGKTSMVYQNISKKDTFGDNGTKIDAYHLIDHLGHKKTVSEVVGEDAANVRAGYFKEIIVDFKH